MNEILELRKRLGLSQVAFAEVLGVNVLTVRRWEKGKNKPSPIARKLLSELYGIKS